MALNETTRLSFPSHCPVKKEEHCLIKSEIILFSVSESDLNLILIFPSSYSWAVDCGLIQFESEKLWLSSAHGARHFDTIPFHSIAASLRILSSNQSRKDWHLHIYRYLCKKNFPNPKGHASVPAALFALAAKINSSSPNLLHLKTKMKMKE